MATHSGIKIWYQSFIDPSEQGPYFRELRKLLAAGADPGVTVDVKGIVPPDKELNRLTEFRCSIQAVRNAVTAQGDGYDAFVIGHFQDGGLYEARAGVDIPVLGLGESSMLYACSLAQKIGIVTIHPVFIPMLEEQIRRYGLQDRIVAVRAITSSPDELVSANDDSGSYQHFLDVFRDEVKPLLEQGVELIIPGGGLPAMLLSRMKGFTVGNGAAVLEPISVVIKLAEVAVKLQRLNGTGPSRTGTFAKASEKAIQEFLE